MTFHVYVVVDCGMDDGDGVEIVSVHKSAVGADSRIKKLKTTDEFRYQYLERKQFEVEN